MPDGMGAEPEAVISMANAVTAMMDRIARAAMPAVGL